jgi:hypothetical protein
MLSDIEAELEREVRDLRSELIRERRARELRTEVGSLAAATSGRVFRSGVARVVAEGATPIFDAAFVFVAYVDDESMVRFEHGPGVPDSLAASWIEVPLETDIPVCKVLRGEAGRIELPTVESLKEWPLLVDDVERSGMQSVCVGRIGDGKVVDAAIVVAWSEPHGMDVAEAELFDLLCKMAGPAFERAQRTESDIRLSTAVQRWLREGRIAQVDGFLVSTLYEPGRDLLRVGGDWFDVLQLDDGRAAVVIGDVVGHDVQAAIEMSQVRHVLASQLKVTSDPTTALAATDEYLRDRAPHIMATALVAVFDRSGHVSLASAGHPPPIIVTPGATARTGVCGLGPPLGTGFGGYSAEVSGIETNDVFCAYTDGLVETRTDDIDSGIERLSRELSMIVGSDDPSPDAVIAMLHRIADTPTRIDDAAAVVVRVGA